MQMNYTFTDREGVRRSAAFWTEAATPGRKLLTTCGTFIEIRRVTTADRKRGVQTEWVQA